LEKNPYSTEKIAYITKGEGRDLVVMHGYGANKECFNRQIGYFSREYRVTAFDFPGFGKSCDIDRAYSVGDYADITADFLSELGIKNPLVIAHSFGGRVAVKMASGSDCFSRLVLTGGAGIVDRRGISYKAEVFLFRAIRKIFPDFADRNFGSAEYKALSPIMKESFKKIVNEDLRDEAENIKCPVLLVYGGKDEITPVSYGKIFKEAIPRSRLVVMENCGHFAFLDDPVSFNMIVDEFLG